MKKITKIFLIKEFPDACVGVRESITSMHERAYIKESQQNAVIVPFSISGKISKGFDRSRFGRIDKSNLYRIVRAI